MRTCGASAIRIRVDGHYAYAHALRGPGNAAGDLAAIRNQQFSKHGYIPEQAEPGVLDRRVETGGDGKAKDVSRLGRIDNAVVPEPCGRVVRVALGFVLFARLFLEGRFVGFRPAAAFGLGGVAADRGEYVRRLLTAHDRNTRVGPGKQEARPVGTAAHAVVAGTVGAANDDREFRHGGGGYGCYELGAVLRDSPGFGGLSDHGSR